MILSKVRFLVVTTSRADYGILYPLLKAMEQDESFELLLSVTGSHLSKEYGYTLDEIKGDGFKADVLVNMNPENDSSLEISNSISKGILGFAESYKRISPDGVIVLGDRYELYAACIPALISRIPIVHIHGGEVTKGAMDDAIRHCITKMASIHFASCGEYAERIIRMGENPSYVHDVGALAVDNIMNTSLYGREELSGITGIDFNKNVALLTYHPVTLDGYEDAARQIDEVLEAVLSTDLKCLITMPGADTAGLAVFKRLEYYAKKYPEKLKLVKSLGRKGYLSAMKYSSIMIGNSSSGIIESPSYRLPVVNIGDRQEGRIKASNIIDCECSKNEILKAIEKGLHPIFKSSLAGLVSPYGTGSTAQKICEVLKEIDFKNKQVLLKKGFCSENVYLMKSEGEDTSGYDEASD